MSQQRRVADGQNGYLIVVAEEVDADGNIICSWVEVYGPDGVWLNSFPSVEAASEYVKTLVEEPVSAPRP